mgnify:CR=1 FL=1
MTHLTDNEIAEAIKAGDDNASQDYSESKGVLLVMPTTGDDPVTLNFYEDRGV